MRCSMLNRNPFIDDMLNSLEKLIKEREAFEKEKGWVESETCYLPSNYIKDRIRFLSNDQRPTVSHLWEHHKTSKTEYLLRLLHHFSPRDEGGFSKEQIEAMLKKHESIVSLICPANYEGLDAFCSILCSADQVDEPSLMMMNK